MSLIKLFLNNQYIKDNICYCWILDSRIRDILPLFIIKLELSNIKNLRLVCIKFQLLIDDYGKLFNLIFRLRVYHKTEKQKIEKIIKKYPIITSFYFDNFNEKDLIACIPNYIKELLLWDCEIKQYKFPSSLELLDMRNCTLSLKCWNSIPTSLSSLSFDNIDIVDENIDKFILIEQFPSNLKELTICGMDLTNFKIWPQNLVHLKLLSSTISSDTIFEQFLSNLKKLTIYGKDLANFKIWPQNLVHLELLSSTISSDTILNLSKISTLSYLKLHFVKRIIDIDLSNFNFLKFLIYAPFDHKQRIYFPSSLQTLTLYRCMYDTVELTKLPKTLINLKIEDQYLGFDLFLLKKENKLPFLKIFINGTLTNINSLIEKYKPKFNWPY